MKILVIGGYGNFGKRLVCNLVDNYPHSITVAGRSAEKAREFCKQIEGSCSRSIDYVELDVLKAGLDSTLKKLSPDIVINASGPYQDQAGENNYAVAKACIAARCHYVDLADAREFVSGFSESLNRDACNAGVMLVTGASTVPGLTAAVVDACLPEFSKLTGIEYGISPGNRTERGEGTISSILSYTGKPFLTLAEGRFETIYGWQGLARYDFGSPIGTRWMSNCDIPDLDLLPKRYPDLNTIRFKAGLEVTLLHCGLWALSGLTRVGLVKNWSRYAHLITRLSEWFVHWGSDSGGMYIQLEGLDHSGQPKVVGWQLVAENGVGPNVPVIAAELIVKRLAKSQTATGAMPCMGLFTLAEFFEIASRWGIYQRRVEI